MPGLRIGASAWITAFRAISTAEKWLFESLSYASLLLRKRSHFGFATKFSWHPPPSYPPYAPSDRSRCGCHSVLSTGWENKVQGEPVNWPRSQMWVSVEHSSFWQLQSSGAFYSLYAQSDRPRPVSGPPSSPTPQRLWSHSRTEGSRIMFWGAGRTLYPRLLTLLFWLGLGSAFVRTQGWPFNIL